MIKNILAVIPLVIVCQASLGNECVQEGDEITLHGSISKETFPGRPNYESIEMGDEPETVSILKTNKKLCMSGTYTDSNEKYTLKELTKFHLVFSDTGHSQTTDASRGLIVVGHIRHAVTGHHHTPAILEVSSIDAAPHVATSTLSTAQIKDTDSTAIKNKQKSDNTHPGDQTTNISTNEKPDYCIGFSSEACSRIINAANTKIRPSYCITGYGLTDSGLDPEQIRICNVTAPPLDIEMKRAELKAQKKSNQRINDARAAVQESWIQYQSIIKSIETGYRCGVIDAIPANISIMKIQEFMEDEKNKYGLIGDKATSIQKHTEEAIQASKNEVERGACEQLTPAWRGKIRSLVSDLVR